MKSDKKEAAYKGLVRPVLEYGSSVWDPHTHGLQEELKKVQNRATRKAVTMSQCASQSEPAERFAHILQPIKDLTRNWDIDIAACLEDYLEELDHITVSFDGGITTMNFAQAAMVLQSSACVYSKKVEYLYSLVYQVLDMLANKKKQSQKSSVDNDGNDEDADFRDKDQDDEFLSLDDLQYGKNIDLREDFDSREEFQLLPQIPLCLIPLEEGEKGENPLVSKKGEVLASRNDFKMNTCCIDPSGTLLLDLSHLALLVATKKIMETLAQKEQDPINSEMEIRDSHEIGCEAQNLSADDNPPGFESMGDEIDGGLPLAEAEPVQPMESADTETVGQDALRRSSRARRLVAVAPPKPTVNPWERFDPHAASKKPEKPFKKGSVHKVCPGVEDKNTKKRKRKKNVIAYQQEPILDYIERACFSNAPKFPKNPMKVSSFPELERLYWEEFKRRQAMMKEMKKKQVVYEEENEEQGEEQEENNPPDIGNDDDNDDDNMAPLVDDNLFNAIEEGMRDHSIRNSFSFSAEPVDDGIIVNSYEDLVRKHVEEYMASAQEYAQITELSKRVSEWEDKIVPRLEEEDRHAPFDINVYGSGIIGGLNPSSTIKFHQLVQGKPLYEICRTFLASLMLANTSNVRIEEKGVLDAGMDNFELELLSTRRHFEELQEYQAPSLSQT